MDPRTAIASDQLPARVAHLYARVSTDEQAEHGNLENQVAFWRRWCDLHGATPGEIFADEGVSGVMPFEARPGGGRLLERARAGVVREVVFFRLDRVGRDVRVILAAVSLLEAAGVRLLSMTEPFDTTTPYGKFSLNISATFAEFERETILARAREGVKRRAASGQYLGGKVPFGCELDPATQTIGPSTRWLEVVGMTEGDFVRSFFEEIGDRNGNCYAICSRYESLGVPPMEILAGRSRHTGRRQVRWWPGALLLLLRNPVYKGEWIHGRQRRPGDPKDAASQITRSVTPLVSPELWERTQARIIQNRLWSDRNRKNRYLLRGLIRCGVCGCAYTGAQLANYEHDEMTGAGSIYRCGARSGQFSADGSKCHGASVRGTIESEIWRVAYGWLVDPGRAIAKAVEELAQNQTAPAELDRARADVARLETALAQKAEERQTVLSLRRRNLMSDEEMVRELAAVDAEVRAIRAERDRMADVLRAATMSDEAVARSRESLEALARETFENVGANPTWEQRRAVVETLVSRVTVHTQAPADPTRPKPRRASNVLVEVHWLISEIGFMETVKNPGIVL